MTGRSSAKKATEAAQTEANRLKEETERLKKRGEAQALRAQQNIIRSLRSRGRGFFETDQPSITGSEGKLN